MTKSKTFRLTEDAIESLEVVKSMYVKQIGITNVSEAKIVAKALTMLRIVEEGKTDA